MFFNNLSLKRFVSYATCYGPSVDTKRFVFFFYVSLDINGHLRQKIIYHVHQFNVTRGKTLPDFIMSFVLLSKTDICLKLVFAHNVRNGNYVTFRI